MSFFPNWTLSRREHITSLGRYKVLHLKCGSVEFSLTKHVRPRLLRISSLPSTGSKGNSNELSLKVLDFPLLIGVPIPILRDSSTMYLASLLLEESGV